MSPVLIEQMFAAGPEKLSISTVEYKYFFIMYFICLMLSIVLYVIILFLLLS